MVEVTLTNYSQIDSDPYDLLSPTVGMLPERLSCTASLLLVCISAGSHLAAKAVVNARELLGQFAEITLVPCAVRDFILLVGHNLVLLGPKLVEAWETDEEGKTMTIHAWV